MFAVIRTGGKQYRVTPNAVLKVEKLEAEPGATVTFTDVLARRRRRRPDARRADRGRRLGHRDGDRAGPAGQGHHLQEAPPAEQPPQERPSPARHRAARRRHQRGVRSSIPWHTRRQAAPRATGATPKAGASASRSPAARRWSPATSSSASAAPSGSRAAMSASAATTPSSPWSTARWSSSAGPRTGCMSPSRRCRLAAE